MADKSKHVVVIGAGCTGLGAALKLAKHGVRVTLLEKSNRVGGLAGGIEIDGNIYEYGPHVFHTTDPEILSDVKDIAGDVLLHYDKTVKIKFLGNYFNFPLSMMDILTKLPPVTVVLAGLSFFFHFLLGLFSRQSSLSNSERVLRRYYGDVLYRIFFKNYITKVWGIEPRYMASEFALQRIPKIDLLKFIEKVKKILFGNPKREVDVDGYVEKTEGEHFTTRKGYYLIAKSYADYLEKLDVDIRLKTGARSVIHENGKCIAVETENDRIECDHVISTIPITELYKALLPRPEINFYNASQELLFRGIVFVGIHVRKEKVLPASFMYFRDKVFNRITDLAQFRVEITPKNSSILVAEITCQPEDELWRNDQQTRSLVEEELIEEGLLQREDIMNCVTFKAKHGYPIYKVGFRENLEESLKGIRQFENLDSTGRQGRFAYINTHIAFKMGYISAREFLSKNNLSSSD